MNRRDLLKSILAFPVIGAVTVRQGSATVTSTYGQYGSTTPDPSLNPYAYPSGTTTTTIDPEEERRLTGYIWNGEKWCICNGCKFGGQCSYK